MGSDNKSDYYASQNIPNVSTSVYYQTDSESTIANKNMSNEWMNANENSEMNNSRSNQEQQLSHEQLVRNSSENKNKNYIHNQSQQQHQWNFPGNTYQRFYGDNHYGIVLTSNPSSQPPPPEPHAPSSTAMTHNFIENHTHLTQQMQSQHLKRVFYQGLKATIQLCPFFIIKTL